MTRTPGDLRRLVVAIAILLVGPLYFICGTTHVCMAGHMQHPPYPLWQYLMDAAWVFAFIVAAVFCWRSNLRLRKTIFLLVVLLFLSRLSLGSGGGGLFILEFPILVTLMVLAVRNLWGGSPDPVSCPSEQRRQRCCRVLRG